MQKGKWMAETLAYGYSSDSILRELSNEYQHDRVKMFFIIFCFFVHCTKVTSASEGLTLMLLMATLANTKWCKSPKNFTETLANGCLSESTYQELSNEYQYDRVWMVIRNLCILVLWTKLASALEGLSWSAHRSIFHITFKVFSGEIWK